MAPVTNKTSLVMNFRRVRKLGVAQLVVGIIVLIVEGVVLGLHCGILQTTCDAGYYRGDYCDRYDGASVFARITTGLSAMFIISGAICLGAGKHRNGCLVTLSLLLALFALLTGATCFSFQVVMTRDYGSAKSAIDKSITTSPWKPKAYPSSSPYHDNWGVYRKKRSGQEVRFAQRDDVDYDENNNDDVYDKEYNSREIAVRQPPNPSEPSVGLYDWLRDKPRKPSTTHRPRRYWWDSPKITTHRTRAADEFWQNIAPIHTALTRMGDDFWHRTTRTTTTGRPPVVWWDSSRTTTQRTPAEDDFWQDIAPTPRIPAEDDFWQDITPTPRHISVHPSVNDYPFDHFYQPVRNIINMYTQRKIVTAQIWLVVILAISSVVEMIISLWIMVETSKILRPDCCSRAACFDDMLKPEAVYTDDVSVTGDREPLWPAAEKDECTISRIQVV